MSDDNIIFLHSRRDVAVAEAIRGAKVEATKDMEDCAVALCLGDCGHKDTRGACFMCERIQVDPVGRIQREAIQ